MVLFPYSYLYQLYFASNYNLGPFMTCIVGLVHDNKVYMGGDSGGIGVNSYEIRKDPKVFTRGEFIYGYAGSFRLGNILQYIFKEPRIRTSDLTEYMVSKFVVGLRACLLFNEYKLSGCPKEDEEDESDEGDILIGIRGHLFKIESDYNVSESIKPYQAIGGGGISALGAMYACKDKDPVVKIRTALEASALTNAVYPPFHILDV